MRFDENKTTKFVRSDVSLASVSSGVTGAYAITKPIRLRTGVKLFIRDVRSVAVRQPISVHATRLARPKHIIACVSCSTKMM